MTVLVVIPPVRRPRVRPFRVLITGSRHWKDRRAIYDRLNALLAEHGSLIVVHGACPTGADKIADDWFIAAKRAGATVFIERKPAIWKVKGRKDPLAGFTRNTVMVELGADLCLAFTLRCEIEDCFAPARYGWPVVHGTHGGTDCAIKARDAGIPLAWEGVAI
jgi:YspA, cpYpsA-related SLOG family